MFLPNSDIEKDALRQGDIISQTHLVGAINLNAITYQIDNNDKKVGWCLPEPRFGPAMVLSHSCELDRANGVKLTSIILAPLRNVNDATRPEKVEELIASNLIDNDTTHSYLKYFYIEPNPLLSQFPSGSIVDFSKCYSVRKQSYDILLRYKSLQLRQDIVDSIVLKFGLYFYRGKLAIA